MKRLGIALVLFLAGSAVSAEQVSLGTGAILRGLDKVNGKTSDLDLANGTSVEFGRLSRFAWASAATLKGTRRVTLMRF